MVRRMDGNKEGNMDGNKEGNMDGNKEGNNRVHLLEDIHALSIYLYLYVHLHHNHYKYYKDNGTKEWIKREK